MPRDLWDFFSSRFLRAALLAEEFRLAALREVVSQLPREHFRKVSRKERKKEKKYAGGGDRIKGKMYQSKRNGERMRNMYGKGPLAEAGNGATEKVREA